MFSEPFIFIAPVTTDFEVSCRLVGAIRSSENRKLGYCRYILSLPLSLNTYLERVDLVRLGGVRCGAGGNVDQHEEEGDQERHPPRDDRGRHQETHLKQKCKFSVHWQNSVPYMTTKLFDTTRMSRITIKSRTWDRATCDKSF